MYRICSSRHSKAICLSMQTTTKWWFVFVLTAVVITTFERSFVRAETVEWLRLSAVNQHHTGGQRSGVLASPALTEDTQLPLASSGDCPVAPPCYCDNRPQSSKAHHVHRINCGPFLRTRRRFPRFVATNEAVEHLSLSYSGLTVIPNAAFRSLRVNIVVNTVL